MPQELLVVNKCDAAGDLALARLRHLLPDAVFVSARRGDGVERLRARIAELLPRPDLDVELLLPYTEGALAARVHAEGEVLAEEHTADGTRLHARVGAELAAAVLPYAASATRAATGRVRRARAAESSRRSRRARGRARSWRRCLPRRPPCDALHRRRSAPGRAVRAGGRRRRPLGDGRRRPPGRAAPARPRTCAVVESRTAKVDPYDAEDLAVGPDGSLWVGDTGDNEQRRSTVALIVVPARGEPELHRLTYPDGPHDAEALLVDARGVPDRGHQERRRRRHLPAGGAAGRGGPDSARARRATWRCRAPPPRAARSAASVPGPSPAAR